MSRALTSRGRWLSKLALGTKPLSRSGRADLQHGSVESLPLEDNSFDKARAINSMQVSPDAVAGLREIRRVMKPGGGGIALAFTPYSGQPNKGLGETLIAAGFMNAHIVETGKGFRALATKQ
jgi:ubiquinone/menaquinone biosynthesis C-methylase UbiE